MFLTQINGTTKTSYEPRTQLFLNNLVIVDLDNVESDVAKSISWTRKLFNEPKLSEEEIFDPTGTNLLNILNLLCPTYFNIVASVKTPTFTLRQNYSEIFKELVSLGYPEEKLPQITKIIQNNKINKRLISQMILWLKGFYERYGIKKFNKNKVRMFYVYRECDEKFAVNQSLEENEISQFYQTQENVQTFEINPSIQKQNPKKFGKIKNSFWGYKPSKTRNRLQSSSLSYEVNFFDKLEDEKVVSKKNLDLPLKNTATITKDKSNTEKEDNNTSVTNNNNNNKNNINNNINNNNNNNNQKFKKDQSTQNKFKVVRNNRYKKKSFELVSRFKMPQIKNPDFIKSEIKKEKKKVEKEEKNEITNKNESFIQNQTNPQNNESLIRKKKNSFIQSSLIIHSQEESQEQQKGNVNDDNNKINKDGEIVDPNYIYLANKDNNKSTNINNSSKNLLSPRTATETTSTNSATTNTDSSGDESSSFNDSSFSENSYNEHLSIDLNDIMYFDNISNKEKEGIYKLKEVKVNVEPEEGEEGERKKEKEKKKRKKKNEKKIANITKSNTINQLNRGRAHTKPEKSMRRNRNKSSNRTKIKKIKKEKLAFLDLDGSIDLRKQKKKNSSISSIENEKEKEKNEKELLLSKIKIEKFKNENHITRRKKNNQGRQNNSYQENQSKSKSKSKNKSKNKNKKKTKIKHKTQNKTKKRNKIKDKLRFTGKKKNEEKKNEEKKKRKKKKLKKKNQIQIKDFKYDSNYISVLNEEEYIYEYINYFDLSSLYLKNTLADLFLMFDKDLKSIYIYEVFFSIRFILQLQKKIKKQTTNEIYSPIGATLNKSIYSAFKMSQNIMRLGTARFKILYRDSHKKEFEKAELFLKKTHLEIRLLTKKNKKNKKKKKNSHQNQNNSNNEHTKEKKDKNIKNSKIVKYRRSWSKKMVFAIHKIDTKIISLEIFERKLFDCFKFRSRYHKMVATFSMILFIISQGKRRTIGYNPKVKRLDTKHLATKFVPLPIIPNEQFLDLYEDINKLKQDRISLIFPKFWYPHGVNFLVNVVVNRQYPIVSGYLKIRKDRLIVGIKGSNTINIHFRNQLQLSKNKDNMKIIKIFWHKMNFKFQKTQEKNIIITMSTIESNLIIKTINHFIQQWNELEIAKKFKKNFH
ncbi:DNA-directed RNA polymerase i subunit rpa34 [Anaeramoeba flamelloides]|uniref:DNA-directed RNA polymerase i subunit rpa34 n=1 Tax=Anaeramoeba flamelloides TaxID=1746091 RepID=A0ABQ8YJ40_9EUKA|nr:DNA-directed RNA polymerase i subunit rpa34 [Anaeramoeba flamelloides]